MFLSLSFSSLPLSLKINKIFKYVYIYFFFLPGHKIFFKNSVSSPGWCGSVD